MNARISRIAQVLGFALALVVFIGFVADISPAHAAPTAQQSTIVGMNESKSFVAGDGVTYTVSVWRSYSGATWGSVTFKGWLGMTIAVYPQDDGSLVDFNGDKIPGLKVYFTYDQQGSVIGATVNY